VLILFPGPEFPIGFGIFDAGLIESVTASFWRWGIYAPSSSSLHSSSPPRRTHLFRPFELSPLPLCEDYLILVRSDELG